MTWYRCGGGNGGSGGTVIVTPDLITDVSGFTKVYDTTSDINYGSLGARVSAALDITDGDVMRAYMLNGWNDSHACFYDAEGKIGAYAGYDFGKEIYLEKVTLYIGKYVQQNKTLYATVQWLDSNGTWNDVTDLAISSSINYPLNVMSVYLNRKCYGVRWVHKNGETKSSGNNIVFFGMLLYQYVDLPAISPLIPEMTSNTTPSGVASASSEYNANYYAYKAFDKKTSSLWGSADSVTAGQWIKYDFGTAKRIVAHSFINRSENNYAVGSFTFQGSNDDSTWTDLSTVSGIDTGSTNFVLLNNPANYRYVRWLVNENAHGTQGTGFVELQVYEGSGTSAPIPTPKELFSFNQSQGGAWINTNVDVTNIQDLMFTYRESGDTRLSVTIPTSDIAVYTGGQDVYTPIFVTSQVGVDVNVRIYNSLLYVSFRTTGANTRVVSVYNPNNLTPASKEMASVFRWYYNSATTCWGILKKTDGDCLGMNGDNADTNVTLDGNLMTVVFHGNSQSVEVTAKKAIILKKYSTGRTLGTVTPDTYTMSASDTQTFTQDNVYGGLFFEAIPNT